MGKRSPTLTIVIPTFDRPKLLPRAVESALGQTFPDIEVIVVDDGSAEPACLPQDPALSVVRLGRNVGGSAARNIGTEAANGHWITYLDDDDELLPDMAQFSLDALAEADLPAPIGSLCGQEVVRSNGEIRKRRFPPTFERGRRFALEPKPAGTSFLTKQSLVVEKQVILEIGGWDESFRSRLHTELFLRLNPRCSILGLPKVGYRLHEHRGPRVSRSGFRRESFNRLVEKHRDLFEADPYAFARLR